MLAGAALEMMLLPVGVVSRTVPLLAEALVIRELRRGAVRPFRMALLQRSRFEDDGRAPPRRGEAFQDGRPAPRAVAAGGDGEPDGGGMWRRGGAARRGRRPRGPRDAGANPKLIAAGRTARPTRRTTGAAAAATRRRRRHFHPLFPPYARNTEHNS